MPIKIRVPLYFGSLIFPPPIFLHRQISRPFNFGAPLFHYKFAGFSFICGNFSSPSNFHAFVLHELAPYNFRTG